MLLFPLGPLSALNMQNIVALGLGILGEILIGNALLALIFH